MRSRIAVQGDRMWRPALMSDRLLEEGLRSGYIACPAEPEVDRLSSLVHRSIQVGPVAAYLDIGLIDPPRAASGPTKAVPTLDELWGISPDPAQNGRMGQMESALGHHFDQIPEAELVAQVPAYAQDDHLTIEVPPCKQLLKTAQLAHHPSSPSRKTTVPDRPCYLHQSRLWIVKLQLSVCTSIRPARMAFLNAA